MTTTTTTTAGLLAGRVILVTGASSGIGEAAARLFAAEGAHVVLTARSADRLAAVAADIRAAGGEAGDVVCDVRRAADVDRAVAFAVERYGRLDGALNNAGRSQGGSLLADVDEDRFDDVVAVNLKGVWLCLRAEIRAMLAAGTPGAIVNVSSVGGLGGAAGLAVYGATKHAVVGLTRSAALEYGERGVRVNAIAPGTTDTAMMARWKEREPGVRERLDALTPLGRGGRPEEVAAAAAWLLSDRASYVSGDVLRVDGGMLA